MRGDRTWLRVELYICFAPIGLLFIFWMACMAPAFVLGFLLLLVLDQPSEAIADLAPGLALTSFWALTMIYGGVGVSGLVRMLRQPASAAEVARTRKSLLVALLGACLLLDAIDWSAWELALLFGPPLLGTAHLVWLCRSQMLAGGSDASRSREGDDIAAARESRAATVVSTAPAHGAFRDAERSERPPRLRPTRHPTGASTPRSQGAARRPEGAAAPERRFLLWASVTRVGRDGDNDVTLDSPTVSREHARIERTMEGYVVIDLDSANGTYINGDDDPAVGRRQLHSGDTIHFGDSAVEFMCLGRGQLGWLRPCGDREGNEALDGPVGMCGDGVIEGLGGGGGVELETTK